MNTSTGRTLLLLAMPAIALGALASARSAAPTSKNTKPAMLGTLVAIPPATRGLLGPDVTTGTVADTFGGFDMEYYGTNDGISGFAIATQACNIGDQEAAWLGGTNEVPVIAQNCYHYEDGVFRQVGLSWLKHSFCALSESESYCGSCTDNNDCDYLAIGCADTYWAGLNGDADGPRTLINPSTGDYDYPFGISPTGTFAMRGKLQIKTEDTNPAQNIDARWVLEAYYMSTDDAEWGNHMNNASWREITFTDTYTPASVGTTNRQDPAILAWDAMEPGGIMIDMINTPEDAGAGRVYVGCKATDIGGGWWHYQYAIQNLNSHRGISSFSLPISDCVEIENETFTDVFYHSGEIVDGTDWEPVRDNGAVSWSTASHDDDPMANAIRWSTMYTFGFDANASPVNGNAELGLWRSGPTNYMDGQVTIPTDDCEGICTGDINGDNMVGVDDLLIVLTFWGNIGDHYADISGDDVVGVDDLLAVISGWGACP